MRGDALQGEVSAGQNLRDWPQLAGQTGVVEVAALFVLGPSSDGTGDGWDARRTEHPGSGRKASASAPAVRGEARTEPSNWGRNPARGATAVGLTQVHAVAAEVIVTTVLANSGSTPVEAAGLSPARDHGWRSGAETCQDLARR